MGLDRRSAVIALMALRLGYGVALIAAPERLSRRWLGPASASAPTQVPLRALGAREIVIHAAALNAVLRGSAARPWLVGSIFGDLTDVLATLAGRSELPEGAASATAVVGGGSALLTALAAAALES